MSTQPPVELHIVSDATGETATRLVAALEAQFPEQPFEEIRHPRVETVDDLRLVVDRAKGRPAVRRLHDRQAGAARGDERLLPPREAPLLRHPRPAARVDREDLGPRGADGARRPATRSTRRTSAGSAAIEFAVKYDDGMGGGLREADIVLVGVSRTSKTPLSMYLGYMGYKTANVPVVRGIEPPAELFEIDPAKIVGLTIDASRLAEIRQERVRHMRANAEGVRGAGRDLRGARAGRARSTGGSAAPCSTSPSSRSRRPPRASSSSSRSASGRGA